jgi:hypothetical protein
VPIVPNNPSNDQRADHELSDEEFNASLRGGLADRAGLNVKAAHSHNLSPSTASDLVTAATAMRFPPALAIPAAETLLQTQTAQRLRTRLENAPLLSSFMSRDSMRAAAVEDSTEALALAEERLNAWRASPMERTNILREVGGEFIDAPRGAAAGLTSLAGTILSGSGQLMQSMGQIDERALQFVEPFVDVALPVLGRRELEDAIVNSETARALGRRMGPIAAATGIARQMSGEAIEEAGDEVKDFADFLRPDEGGFEDQVYEALGQIAGAVGLSFVGGPGLTTTAFAMQGVDMQATRLEQAGLDPDENFGVLAAGGVVTGLSEQVRLGRVLDAIPPRLRNSVFARALQGRLGGMLARGVGEGIEEATQEGVEGVAHSFIERTYNEDANLFEGMFEEMSVAGVSGALFQIIMEAAAPGRARGARTEEARNLLDQINEAVEQAPVTQRSREVVREFVEGATGDQTVNISADGITTLYQSEEGLASLREIGVTDDQIATALTYGSDVEVRVDALVTSPSYAAIADHVRVSGEDATTAELQSGILSEVVAVDVAEAARDIAERVAREEAGDAVGDSIQQQLIDAGRPEAEAAAAGSVWSAVMDGISQRTGQSPSEVFERLNVSIQNRDARPERDALNQPVIRLGGTPSSRVIPPFRNAVDALGFANFLNESEIVTRSGGGIELSLAPAGPRTVHLSSLRAIEPGGGGRALRELTALADLYGVDIQLTAAPFEGGPNARTMTATELDKWYRGFGFEGQRGGLLVRKADREGSAALNVGLAIGDENGALSPARVRAALPEGVEIRGETLLKSDNIPTLYEDTMVLQLSRPLTPEELDQMSIDTEQEAIAQMYGQDGTLGGPKAADWGPFNPDFFHMPNGSIASRAVIPQGRELEQSAVELARAPIDIVGTGPGQRVTNKDLAAYLTERHMEEHGRTLDAVNDEADYELVKDAMREDLEYQMGEAGGDTGANWYTADVAEAMRKMQRVFPELSDPVKRDLFIALAAITSPRERPVANWQKASLLWEQYRVDGTLPTVKPNGKAFGTNSVTSAVRLMEHLISTKGEAGAIEFMFTAQSGTTLAEIRRDSGIFKDGDQTLPLSQYKANETSVKEGEYMGARLFGPKVGDFMLNATGVDPNAITVDIWNHRTWDRLTGQLQSYRDKAERKAGITNDTPRPGERDTIERMQQELAAEKGIEPSSVQALLWYYEQKLFRDHGIYSPSQSFSDGAQSYLERRIELNGERIDARSREATEQALRDEAILSASRAFAESGKAFSAQAVPVADGDQAEASFQSGQVQYSLDEIFEVADKKNNELNASLAEIADAFGLEHNAGPTKKRVKVEAKIKIKKYKDNGRLTDIMRGTLIVDTVDQYQAAIEALATRYEVFDEGWATPDPNGESGYFDAKAIVRFDNGMLGEVQFMPRAIADAKKNGGHDIYDQITDALKERRYEDLPALQKRSTEFYSAALEGEPYWSQIRDVLAAAKGNVSSQWLLSNIRASERIALTSASSQLKGSRFENTNTRENSREGSSTSTAGRRSADNQNLISIAGGAPFLNTFEEGPVVYSHDQDRTLNQARLTGYTGSPAKFTEFNNAYLGSGEGVHAFGYGHYTAENISVARYYYEALGNKIQPANTGDPVRKVISTVINDAADAGMDMGDISVTDGGGLGEGTHFTIRRLEDPAQMQAALDEALANEGFIDTDELRRQAGAKPRDLVRYGEIDGLQYLVRGIYGKSNPFRAPDGLRITVQKVKPGQLAETSFAPGPFIQWEHSLERLVEDLGPEGFERVAGDIQDEMLRLPKPEYYNWATVSRMLDNPQNYTGSLFYNYLTRALGGSQQAASEWLHERGVIGVKYEDGFSRGRENKTYNYVIFDAVNIDVVDNTLFQNHTPPPADEDGIIRVNGREYPARQEGEELKPYLKRAIDTMPAPEALPFEPDRFFDLSGEHYMIPMDQVVSTKSDEENQQGASNAPKRFLAAYDGIIPARGPITVRMNEQGKFEIVDGNGTFSAFKAFGWTEIPAALEEQAPQEPAGEAPRASVTIPGEGVLSDREVLVRLSNAADASSFMHESAHIFLEIYSALEGEYAEVAEIMRDVRAWLGAEQGVPFTTDQHEKFAESFEAYLMEGKAPSPELRGAFTSFRRWISKVYQSIRGSLRNLEPEAVQIFDKMLAADAAVQREETQAQRRLSEALQDIMTEEEIAKHSRLLEKARSEAVDEITQRVAAKIERANRAEVRAARARIKAEAKAEVEADPLYTLIEFITNEGGEQFNRAAVETILTPEQLKRLPRGKKGLLTADGGITDLEAYAVENGFLSADSMLQRLVGANGMAKEIVQRTEREAERQGVALMTDAEIDAAATAATFTKGGAEIMAAELNALSRKALIKGIPLAAIRDQAKRLIEGRPMSEMVKPGRYAASSRALHRKALRAAARQDWSEAVRLMQQALMQHELSRLAYAARAEVERGNRRVSKYRPSKNLPKSHDVAYTEVLRLVYGLPTSENSIEDGAKILQFLETHELGDVPVMTEVSLGRPVPSVRDMTLDQFRAWRDMVLAVGKKARDSESYNRGEWKQKMERLAMAIEDNAGNEHAQTEFGEENKRKDSSGWRNWIASLRRLPYLVRVLDGGPDATGPVYKFIIEPLREASNWATEQKNKNQDWFRNFFDQYSDKLRFDQHVHSEVLGHDLTGEQVFAILANTGNASNRERLLNMPANETGDIVFRDAEHLQQFIDEMGTPERMEAVQALWDHINSYWQSISDMHRRTTGVRPKKVEATPVTAQGQTYRGGYYPLAYDSHVPGNDPKGSGTEDTASATRAYDDAKIKSGVLIRASTRQGHTIERANGVERRIDLSIDVATRHIDNAIHDLAFREVYADIWRGITNKDVHAAITNAIGPNNYKAIKTMLQRVVAGQSMPQEIVGRMMRSLRTKAVTALLGINMRVVLTQPLALTQSMAKLGKRNVMYAIAEYITDMQSTIKFVMENSAFMRNRDRTMARDIKEMLRENAKPTPLDRARELSLWMMQKMDVYGSAIPTWLAAFRMKQREGWTDREAALFADTTVADTQGSGEDMDLSTMQSGGEMEKLFTFMYGYFSGTLNLTVEAGQNIKQGRVAKGVSQLFMLHAVQGALAILLMQGLPDDDDDDGELLDDYMLAAGMGTLENVVGSVPMAREVLSSIKFGSGQETALGRLLGSGVRTGALAFDTLEDAFIEGEVEAEKLQRLTVSTLQTGGLLTGLPTFQVARAIDATLIDETPSAYEILVSGRDRGDDE